VQGIAQSLGRIDSKDLEALEAAADGEGGLPSLAATIIKRQIEALQTTLLALDFEAIERASTAIATARRVVVIGHGGALVPAMGMAIKLNWVGVAAHCATPDEFSNTVISTTTDDLMIGISHQGRTRDVVELLRLARKLGASTMGISTVPHSPLADVSDISLAVLSPDIARAGTFFLAFDTLMVMADLLAATVAERKWGGTPPHRPEVVEWIETNLRVGPLPMPASDELKRGPRRKASPADDEQRDG
jgi:DNA-binding MurR/RpiR family transcriptional regulator